MLPDRSAFRLLLFFVPILIVLSALPCPAAELQVPENIGSRFSPYALPDFSAVPFWIPPLTGLAAGLLTAAIGTGGGFMVVPALMTYGVSGIYAVGAEIFRLFVFTLLQAIRLGLRKKIRYLFSGVLSIGTAIGGFAGLFLSTTIYMNSPPGSNLFISLIIVMWMITYAFVMIPDFKESAAKYALQKAQEAEGGERGEAGMESGAIQTGPGEEEGEGSTPAAENEENIPQDEKKEIESFEAFQLDDEPWEIAHRIRGLRIPPYLKFPSSLPKAQDDLLPDRGEKEDNDLDQSQGEEDTRDRISLLPVFLFSIAGGFFMALTGSGGLIFGFTIFTRAFACMAELMAGADFARIAVSSGALTMGGFGIKGFISFYSVTGLILGSVAGLHLGGHTMKYIEPYRVKGLVSLSLITVIINRLLALPEIIRKAGGDLPYDLCSALDGSSKYILLIGLGTTAVWFLFELAAGIRSMVKQPDEKEGEEEKAK